MKKTFICFLVFVITGIGSTFLGISGDTTFVVGAICTFLVFMLMSKKKSSRQKTSASLRSGSKSSSHNGTNFFDERNLPSFWVRARACDSHDDVTVSQGNATHCYMCGKHFDGSWGDRGLFDGHFCQRHKKWIALGDYCQKCANEGLIKP